MNEPLTATRSDVTDHIASCGKPSQPRDEKTGLFAIAWLHDQPRLVIGPVTIDRVAAKTGRYGAREGA
ncbi:hypothetical protein EHS19_04265 [Bifidobacterium jacchi]|uniref:Uncharacterized protein n=1 Tax=Bifidobacterium jacchi TaxID=2490545 RepID=A0A5N5RK37_9BIFI|nr:hypothetical protein EHS19_04265 [Bifidobacterium jacchi]